MPTYTYRPEDFYTASEKRFYAEVERIRREIIIPRDVKKAEEFMRKTGAYDENMQLRPEYR